MVIVLFSWIWLIQQWDIWGFVPYADHLQWGRTVRSLQTFTNYPDGWNDDYDDYKNDEDDKDNGDDKEDDLTTLQERCYGCHQSQKTPDDT